MTSFRAGRPTHDPKAAALAARVCLRHITFLHALAAERGKTVSEVLREVLDEAMTLQRRKR